MKSAPLRPLHDTTTTCTCEGWGGSRGMPTVAAVGFSGVSPLALSSKESSPSSPSSSLAPGSSSETTAMVFLPRVHDPIEGDADVRLASAGVVGCVGGFVAGRHRREAARRKRRRRALRHRVPNPDGAGRRRRRRRRSIPGGRPSALDRRVTIGPDGMRLGHARSHGILNARRPPQGAPPDANAVAIIVSGGLRLSTLEEILPTDVMFATDQSGI